MDNRLLVKLRNQVDSLDQELVKLLCKRGEIVQEIARLKLKNQLPVLDQHREDEILERAKGLNTGPFLDADILAIFQVIMGASKRLQEKIVSPQNFD